MSEQVNPKKFKGYILGEKLSIDGPVVTVAAVREEDGEAALIKFINWHVVPDGERLAAATIETARHVTDEFSGRVEMWPLLDSGAHGRWLYLVERRTEMLTLAEALDLHGPIEAPSCVERADPLVRAVSEMHAAGMVCGFIGPENVFVKNDGSLILGDFLSPAFAFLFNRERGKYTPLVGYLAPELIRGERTDPRTDVFAIAALIYLTVSGRGPFPAKMENDTHWDVRGVPVDCTLFGMGCNSHFSQVLRWAMSQEPDRRPVQPRRLIMDLRAALLEIDETPAETPPEPQEKKGRGKAAVAAEELIEAASPAADKDWMPPELAPVLEPRKSKRMPIAVPILVVLLGVAAGLAAAWKWMPLPRFNSKPPPPVAQCPNGMIEMTAGDYAIGENDAQDGVPPRHSENVTAYCIDTFEYPGEAGQMPKSGVSWNQADKLCRDRGKRLCSEIEWEAACAGPQGIAYPYENKYSADICNTYGAEKQASGALKGCASRTGAADMSGNLAEWTSGWFHKDRDHTLRGGSWASRSAAKCSARFDPAKIDSAQIGFRCCVDLKK